MMMGGKAGGKGKKQKGGPPQGNCKWCQMGQCWDHGVGAGGGGGGGGYGAMKGGKGMAGMMAGMMRATPYAQTGSLLAETAPASNLEVEQFLVLNPVEEHAASQFRGLDPKVQRLVINKGSLEGARDPTAAFIGRMAQMKRIGNGQVDLPPGDWICANCGDHQFARNETCRKCHSPKPESAKQAAFAVPNAWGGDAWGGAMTGGAAAGSPLQDTVPASPAEVEQFLILNMVEPHAQAKFRGMDPKAQRLVINKGSLEGARDPTAAFISRCAQIEKIARGQVMVPPGDWICNSCGDHQFARNESCRKCGAAKPAGAGAGAMGGGGDMSQMMAMAQMMGMM